MCELPCTQTASAYCVAWFAVHIRHLKAVDRPGFRWCQRCWRPSCFTRLSVRWLPRCRTLVSICPLPLTTASSAHCTSRISTAVSTSLCRCDVLYCCCCCSISQVGTAGCASEALALSLVCNSDSLRGVRELGSADGPVPGLCHRNAPLLQLQMPTIAATATSSC